MARTPRILARAETEPESSAILEGMRSRFFALSSLVSAGAALAVTAVDIAPGSVPGGPRGPKGATGAQGPQGVSGLAAPEGWQPLQLLNGWGNYGASFQTASFTKDQLGYVHLRGLVTRDAGAPTLSSLIGVLPAGYRPKADRVYAVHTGEAPYATGRVDVHVDGQVLWIDGATGERDYTSLEGIEFTLN